jgi:hypothetical protein
MTCSNVPCDEWMLGYPYAGGYMKSSLHHTNWPDLQVGVITVHTKPIASPPY